MCETRSAVSMLEKCIRKPSRNPYTNVSLGINSTRNILGGGNDGWSLWTEILEGQSVEGDDGDDLTTLELPNPTDSNGAGDKPQPTASAVPTLERGHDIGTAVTLHKVLQSFMARSTQGSLCFLLPVLPHHTMPCSSLFANQFRVGSTSRN